MKCRYCAHVVKETLKSGERRYENSILPDMRSHLGSKHPDQAAAIYRAEKLALGDMRYAERQARN